MTLPDDSFRSDGQPTRAIALWLAGQDRFRCQSPALDGKADALACQWVYQTSRIAGQQDAGSVDVFAGFIHRYRVPVAWLAVNRNAKAAHDAL